MKLQLLKSQIITDSYIQIKGSKSETNRLLILQRLFPLEICNESDSDDSKIMRKSLEISKGEINIGHAGTTMRFLTAYFACLEGHQVILTGSERMKQRPIGVLVTALKDLGADIQYIENEGFPPLKINGKKLNKSEISIEANISSQYISALLLIGSKLNNGLKINLLSPYTSFPYIQMTLSLLEQIGVKTKISENTIEIYPSQITKNQTITIESDWSSASYFYSFIALSPLNTEITLSWYKKNSMQGDSSLSDIYRDFGVKTIFSENKITLQKNNTHEIKYFSTDLTNTPDIAQTIIVTCFGLGISCHLTGLHTLKIKETDRLEALKIELTKLGAQVQISDNHIQMTPIQFIENKEINTYNDHRMAMAFAPLCLKKSIIITDAQVVSKSYPNFWKDCSRLGIRYKEIS